MFFISAPFGNYLKFKNSISVTGTWTLNPRPGLLKQIIKTLRYVKTEQGRSWRNKLGLRNPGLHVGMLKTSYNQVMSVAALEPSDWEKIRMAISPERSIELNISCPNLDTHEDTTSWNGFDKFPQHMRGDWCIVKIPPVAPKELIDKIQKFENTTKIPISQLNKVYVELHKPQDEHGLHKFFRKASLLDLNKHSSLLESIPELSRLNDSYGNLYEKYRDEWIEKSIDKSTSSVNTNLRRSVRYG